MRKMMIATLALAMAAAGAARAEGTAGQRELTESIVVEASQSDTWKVVGDVEDSNWLEHVDTTLVQGGDPATSTRTLTLHNGRVIVEKGRSYDADQHSFGFDVTERDARDLPVDDYSATISVTPSEGGNAKVQWTARFRPAPASGDASSKESGDAAEKAVRDWTHASLLTLKSRVEKGRRT